MTGASHPYKDLPPECFWRRAVAAIRAEEIDPVVVPKFVISPSDRVVTAGSCFAQHISRHLTANGFNYIVTESVHPEMAGSQNGFQYGVFSARYGNVYTSRQLVQLIKRAYGDFVPVDNVWMADGERVMDPFRPQIQPHGFSCMAEYLWDRTQHFAAVRHALESMDVFIFTLGLTEVWINAVDGAAYPLCPGVAGGSFDATQHKFTNLDVGAVTADLKEAVTLIRARNPTVRFILTVSPVPLIATAERRSVIVSTAYSKAVLLVAAQSISAMDDAIAYFPSYEIITGTASRGQYFADDLRSVTEAGVNHVMRIFMRHYGRTAHVPAAPQPTAASIQPRRGEMEQMVDVMCDEEIMERHLDMG
jgi:GSCFA family